MHAPYFSHTAKVKQPWQMAPMFILFYLWFHACLGVPWYQNVEDTWEVPSPEQMDCSETKSGEAQAYATHTHSHMHGASRCRAYGSV